jgi:hypothetical protein
VVTAHRFERERNIMRGGIRLSGLVGVVGLGALAVVGGCWPFTESADCQNAFLGCPTTGTSSGTGAHDGGTGGHASCDPAKGAVDASCGVFVSSSKGDDANAGSESKPLKTLGAALNKAGGGRVYACGESFAEAIKLSAGATLYGALDCANGWVYDASKKTQLTATAGSIPLRITMATTGVEVSDFTITSADATADGGSSIAVVVAQATASFVRCDLVAGSGKAGLAGAAYQMSAQAGVNGNAGKDACSADTSLGGKAVTSMCGNPDSISGAGGIGDTAAGGSGSPGLPASASNGGAGEGAGVCTPGKPGDVGGAGNPSVGATGLGTLSTSGYAGVSGTDGMPGLPGQGGGGGGGAKGELSASACPAGSGGGASGGSGGSGGCGGMGGKGGGAGGASIALVSIEATLTFVGVTLEVGTGGNGGDGGPGQDGGMGGTGAAGGMGKGTLKIGCAGGAGSKGGVGGKGSGGAGGHAIGIAYTGKAPPMSGIMFTSGTAGAGGTGDDTMGNLGDGAPGVAANAQMFQ